MYILPIENINKKNNTTCNFKSCIRSYRPKITGLPDIFEKSEVLTTSNCFRGDLNWKKNLFYINWHFLDKKHVNIHCLACADGAEPTSYAIGLDKYNLDKYSIYASDIDGEILKPALNGKIVLVKEDFQSFDYMGVDYDYYFRKTDKFIVQNSDSAEHEAYEISPEIKHAINYKQADILEHLSTIDDNSNSVVNIRNVMPYLKSSYVDKIFETLAEKLKKGSLFIHGAYDRNILFLESRLNDIGFYEVMTDSMLYQKAI